MAPVRLIPIFILYLYIMTLLASFNTQGLRSQDRLKTAFNFFLRNRFDIILLQETHWTADMEMLINREWSGNIFYSHGTNTARGVAILVSSRLNASILEKKGDNEGRIINVTIEIDDHSINIINIYAPSTDTERQTFFTTIGEFVSDGQENIIAGDFNCIFNTRLDSLGGDPNRRNSAASTLQTICSQHNLVDIWRERNKDKRCFTWTGRHPYNDSYISTRIDKFFTTRSLNPFIAEASIKPYPFSDHDYISLALSFDKIKRGPGYWHFNNDLLSNVNFLTEIEEFWNEWSGKIDDFANPLVWWDKTKQHFKKIAIRCAKVRNKLQRHEKLQLERKLEKLKARSTSGETRDIEEYLLAKEKMKLLELKELDAIKTRTKVQFLEEGEKSTRYFFSLEKCRKADQTIRLLTKQNLDAISEPEDILKETHDFYKSLFDAEPGDEHATNQFLNDSFPKLTDSAKEICEGPIAEGELRKAVQSMENNKSPGLDGLTANFYKKFWGLLSKNLTIVFNYAYENGQLSTSQRRGVISLLFKKGDRTQLKNWRPITLLNTDYKILTKALANRLQRVLPSIIHSDQTASIKGRTINDNIRLLHDVITYANENNLPLAVISVDQLKAFDRVSHDYLLKTLESFGFGPSFIKWIKTIYNCACSSVKPNGWMTAFIDLGRGLRQGCALSMPLYVLTAETLAIKIRENKNVKGIFPPGSKEELKLSQYADDTTLLLTDDDSITEAFKTFDLYERASGAKINKSKCKGLFCGAFSERTDQPYNFEWFTDYIPDKILGQFLGNVDCTTLNWRNKIDNIKNIIDAWRHRDLSMKGKALVINGLLTSTIWYNVTSLPVPQWVIQQLETIIYDFFWSYKKHLINKDILALPLGEGGFNIPRLQTRINAFRLNTLRRLLQPEDAHWKHFVSYFLRISRIRTGKLNLVLNYDRNHIESSTPPFHKELLLAWLAHKQLRQRVHPPETLPDILAEPLFQNDLISINHEPLMLPDWISAGITQIKDLTYETIPGFLPPRAIHELLTKHRQQSHRTLSRTAQELQKLHAALPYHWRIKICTEHQPQPPDHQPNFVINTKKTRNPPVDILTCKTRHFYSQLQKNKDTPIPGVEYWTTNLQLPPLEPFFNDKHWKTLYPPLATNKQGDLNWKITHRVVHTALSLNRMGVWATPNCHRCGALDTLEHAFIDCPAIVQFWDQIQLYVDKITAKKLTLTTLLKLFGRTARRNDPMGNRKIDLVNWILTLSRWAIHKSGVNYRVHNSVISPETLFKTTVKAHLKFQYKLYRNRLSQYLFPFDWCIGEALAKIENEQLIFTL